LFLLLLLLWLMLRTVPAPPPTGYNYVQDGRLEISANRVQLEGWNSGLTANSAASDVLGR
jgi:hypothetical protein